MIERPAHRPLLLTNIRLVDLATPAVRPDVWLRIDDGRIAAIGSGTPPRGDSAVEDLAGAFVLPGLWDVHAHPAGYQERPKNETLAGRTLHALDELAGAARAGITSVRSAGEHEYIDCAARDFFARGVVVGPRVVPAGWYLTTTAGHGEETDPGVRCCDGPVAWQVAVRDNIRHGAEVIKVNLSGGLWGPAWDNILSFFQSEDELQAAFETAKQRGLPVMAHATNPAAVKAAVRMGVRSIEHGYVLDEESVVAMKDAGTVFVPTLTFSQLAGGVARDEYERAELERLNFPPEFRAKAPAAAELAERSFRMALAAGVTIAAGSDVNPIAEGGLLEVVMLTRFGMKPHQALLAATKTAAELCGYGDVSGEIAVGKEADLLAVERDPLEDIYAVRRQRGVWKRGVRVS